MHQELLKKCRDLVFEARKQKKVICRIPANYYQRWTPSEFENALDKNEISGLFGACHYTLEDPESFVKQLKRMTESERIRLKNFRKNKEAVMKMVTIRNTKEHDWYLESQVRRYKMEQLRYKRRLRKDGLWPMKKEGTENAEKV